MRFLNFVRSVRNWWTYLPVKLGISRRDPLIFETRNGVSIEVPRQLLPTFKELFMARCYDGGLDPLGDAPVIVDVGANVGYFSLYMASRHENARILAFEPLPQNFDLLARNFGRNSGRQLECWNKAVFGEPGSVTLNFPTLDEYSTGASVLGLHGGETEIEVEAISLDDVFREHGLESLDLLKLDCEGSEYSILYQVSPENLKKVRQVVLEAHSGPGERENETALKSYLEEHGFSVATESPGLMWARRREDS